MITLPVFGFDRHRLATDGQGVTTLVGAFGCPLKCKYCLNPHAWDSKTLEKCKNMTPEELYDVIKKDDLYFKATGGGVCFGGGESLLHTAFLTKWKALCGDDWKLITETSLNVPLDLVKMSLSCVDEYIVDIKDMNPDIYKKYTLSDNANVFRNLKYLSEQGITSKVTIRLPLIPGFNNKSDIAKSQKALEQMGFTNFDHFTYIIRQTK